MYASLLSVLFAGCSTSVDCSSADVVLAESPDQAPLTCGQTEVVIDYIKLLAGRPVTHTDVERTRTAIADRFREDPVAARAWLETVRISGLALGGAGLQATAARSERVWMASNGLDIITSADEDLWNVQSRALSVWAKDDEERMAMTESDLEAWIRYASLCREVQGAGGLRISVADRVTVYRDIIDRFNTSDRETKLALGSMGAIWQQVQERWQQAPYTLQQSWIAAAPLPPPMTSTSLGYAEAIFASDLVSHAKILHEVLGPFRMTAPGAFSPSTE